MMGRLGGLLGARMESLNTAASSALRQLLDLQPISAAKVAFAWKMVAGGPLGRATEAEWRPGGVLVIRASSDAWRREVRAARTVLQQRLNGLLGPGVVAKLVIEGSQ